MKRSLNLFVVIIFLFVSSCADIAHHTRQPASRHQTIFGPEWTFTNNDLYEAWAESAESGLVNTPVNEAARDKLAEKIMSRCKNCEMTIEFDTREEVKFQRIHVSSNFFIDVTVDPAVVEVKTSPLTALEFSERGKFIQEAIFDSAREIGIVPNVNAGGGHIHIDVARAFDGDVLHFKNFLADMINNSFLFQGIFGADPSNAPTYFDLTEKQQEAFKNILIEVEKNPDQWSVQKLAETIEKDVYYATPANWVPPQKYQNINLTRVGRKEAATVEIRAFHAQSSSEHFALLTEMLDRRIEWTKKQKIVKINEVNISNHTDGLWRFLYEINMNFQDFLPFIEEKQWPAPKTVWETVKAQQGAKEALKYMNDFYQKLDNYPSSFIDLMGRDVDMQSLEEWLPTWKMAVERNVGNKNWTAQNISNVFEGPMMKNQPEKLAAAWIFLYERTYRKTKVLLANFLPLFFNEWGGWDSPFFCNMIDVATGPDAKAHIQSMTMIFSKVPANSEAYWKSLESYLRTDDKSFTLTDERIPWEAIKQKKFLDNPRSQKILRHLYDSNNLQISEKMKNIVIGSKKVEACNDMILHFFMNTR